MWRHVQPAPATTDKEWMEKMSGRQLWHCLNSSPCHFPKLATCWFISAWLPIATLIEGPVFKAQCIVDSRQVHRSDLGSVGGQFACAAVDHPGSSGKSRDKRKGQADDLWFHYLCCSTCTWVHTFIACGKIIWLVELVHLFLKAIPLMFLFHHGSQGGVHGVPRWAPIQTVMIFGEVAASCALRASTVFDFHWLKPWCLDLLGGQGWLWSSEITWSARQQEII